MSQKTMILGYLAYKDEDGATAMELIEWSGSTNVRARISELREDGFNIVNLTSKKLRECGIESRHNLYFLGKFTPKSIEDALEGYFGG
jgi:hypothetical protein